MNSYLHWRSENITGLGEGDGDNAMFFTPSQNLGVAGSSDCPYSWPNDSMLGTEVALMFRKQSGILSDTNLDFFNLTHSASLLVFPYLTPGLYKL